MLEWLDGVALPAVDVELWERGVLHSARPLLLARTDDVRRGYSAAVVQNLLTLLQEREGRSGCTLCGQYNDTP